MYDNQVLGRLLIPVAVDMNASAGDTFTWIFPTGKAIHVKDVGLVLTEVVGDATTQAVMSLDHTPSGGSRAEKAVITSVAADAVGVEERPGTAFTSATEFDVVAGDSLIFEHKTQASGGTVTGAGYFVLYYTEIPV